MGIEEQDQQWMAHALNLACRAEEEGEVPIGAVVVKDGVVIGEGWNRPIALHDPTAHAEVQAIRAAAIKQCNYRLPGSTLYVTLEPCTMCAGAFLQARIERVVFATTDPRSGAVESQFQLLNHAEFNHRCRVDSGPLAAQSAALLKQFFRKRRNSPSTRVS